MTFPSPQSTEGERAVPEAWLEQQHRYEGAPLTPPGGTRAELCSQLPAPLLGLLSALEPPRAQLAALPDSHLLWLQGSDGQQSSKEILLETSGLAERCRYSPHPCPASISSSSCFITAGLVQGVQLRKQINFPLLDLGNSQTKGQVRSFGKTTAFFMTNMPHFTSLTKSFCWSKCHLLM